MVARHRQLLLVLAASTVGCGDHAYWQSRERSSEANAFAIAVAVFALGATAWTIWRSRTAPSPAPLLRWRWLLLTPAACVAVAILAMAQYEDALLYRDLPLAFVGIAPALWCAVSYASPRAPMVALLAYTALHVAWAMVLLPPRPSSPVKTLRGGSELGVAVLEDGAVWQWPRDGRVPRQVEAIAAAEDVVSNLAVRCALLRDGGVQCWSDGPAQRVERISDAVSLQAGDTQICALLRSGAVACFDPTTRAVTMLPDVDDAVSLGVGYFQACIARQNGTVHCWGQTLGSWAGLADIAEVAVGTHHACARRRDGRVLCWGDNTWGMLGDGTREARDGPVLVEGIADAVEIGAGDFHSCARLAAGDLMCWGEGAGGQLGVHPRELEKYASPQPRRYPFSGGLVIGDGYTCARTEAGLHCSGWNVYNSTRTGANDHCDGTVGGCTTTPRPVSLID